MKSKPPKSRAKSTPLSELSQIPLRKKDRTKYERRYKGFIFRAWKAAKAAGLPGSSQNGLWYRLWHRKDSSAPMAAFLIDFLNQEIRADNAQNAECEEKAS